MTEVLQSLPADHQLYAEIVNRYKNMMSSLLEYQAESGMWRQLVDNKLSWEETSCSAMFAYAMAAGVHNGWLDDVQYESAVQKAWKALRDKLDPQGNLPDVCAGTGQKNDVEYYLNRPRTKGDLHGQAPFLWLACELMENQ